MECKGCGREERRKKMRKAIALLLCLVSVLALSAVCFADQAAEVSALTDEQLTTLYSLVKQEMKERGLKASEILNLQEGKYIIGEDIEPGTYKFTCTGMLGEDLNDAYSSLGDAYGAILGDSSWGSLFGSLGNAMETLSYMTIEIIGDYGTVQKTVQLTTGESVDLTLSTGYAVQLTDGTCTAEMK